MSIFAIFERFGGMNVFCPLGSAFEGHGSPPPANTYACIPTMDVRGIFRDGCNRLGAPSFSALVTPWSPKAAIVASDIGPSPLQGTPAGDLVLLNPLTLRKSSVDCTRPNTHPRKIHYGDPA